MYVLLCLLGCQSLQRLMIAPQVRVVQPVFKNAAVVAGGVVQDCCGDACGAGDSGVAVDDDVRVRAGSQKLSNLRCVLVAPNGCYVKYAALIN